MPRLRAGSSILRAGSSILRRGGSRLCVRSSRLRSSRRKRLKMRSRGWQTKPRQPGSKRGRRRPVSRLRDSEGRLWTYRSDSVGPKYRAPASVSAPNVTFISPRGSSAGKWYKTTASNQGQISDDTIVVYSDVGAPSRTPIMEVHGAFAEDADSTSLLAIDITDAHNNLITSSRFPSPGRTATIPLTIDSTDDDVDNDDMTAKLSGRFDGASGTFQCSGGACTVRHTGGGYVLDGDWTFRTSKNSKVNVPDGEFMSFGWWRQKTKSAARRICLPHVQQRRKRSVRQWLRHASGVGDL